MSCPNESAIERALARLNDETQYVSNREHLIRIVRMYGSETQANGVQRSGGGKRLPRSGDAELLHHSR